MRFSMMRLTCFLGGHTLSFRHALCLHRKMRSRRFLRWAGTAGPTSRTKLTMLRGEGRGRGDGFERDAPDAGYVYVNIDDTWEGERDAQGRDPIEQQVSRHEGACGWGLCAVARG